jgi:hypothetical protein
LALIFSNIATVERIDGKFLFLFFRQCVKSMVGLKNATELAGINVMAPDIAKAMGGQGLVEGARDTGV